MDISVSPKVVSSGVLQPKWQVKKSEQQLTEEVIMKGAYASRIAEARFRTSLMKVPTKLRKYPKLGPQH